MRFLITFVWYSFLEDITIDQPIQQQQQQLTSFIVNQDINYGENLASDNSQDLPILLNTPTVVSQVLSIK